MADSDDIQDAAAEQAASGVKSVTTDGQNVTFNSPSEAHAAARNQAMRGKTVKQLFSNSTRMISANPRA